jgi:hypothetical protein
MVFAWPNAKVFGFFVMGLTNLSICNLPETVSARGLDLWSSLEKFHFSLRAVYRAVTFVIFPQKLNFVWIRFCWCWNLVMCTESHSSETFQLWKVLDFPVLRPRNHNFYFWRGFHEKFTWERPPRKCFFYFFEMALTKLNFRNVPETIPGRGLESRSSSKKISFFTSGGARRPELTFHNFAWTTLNVVRGVRLSRFARGIIWMQFFNFWKFWIFPCCVREK